MAKIIKVGRSTLPAGTKVEICRSFGYKLNAGNYESRDFFQSAKAECPIEDGPDISDRLYEFCRSQVLKSVNDYMALQKLRDEKKAS